MPFFIAGQKSFGAAVYKAVRNAGHTVTGVACPADGQYYDRLKKAAYCDTPRPVIIDDEQLRAADIPDETDVIIAAHSHHFISTKARSKVKYAFGYHPSLLPRHRGKDAVKWTIRFGDAVVLFPMEDGEPTGRISGQGFFGFEYFMAEEPGGFSFFTEMGGGGFGFHANAGMRYTIPVN